MNINTLIEPKYKVYFLYYHNYYEFLAKVLSGSLYGCKIQKVGELLFVVIALLCFDLGTGLSLCVESSKLYSPEREVAPTYAIILFQKRQN